jgi:hypothetical protein
MSKMKARVRAQRFMRWPVCHGAARAAHRRGAHVIEMTAVLMCSAVMHGWAQPLPLTPSAWDIRYSDGPVHPSVFEEGWAIEFTRGTATPKPTQDCKCQGIGYVTTNWNKPIAGSSITITFAIVATPGAVFDFKTERENTCATPANFRLLIERKDDKLTEPSYRWWSNPINYPLQNTNGLASLTIPLNGDNWSDVYGVTGAGDPTGFAAALADAGPVGITFGGGCFFGHGAYVTSGAATFALKSYVINP